jgi:hypothetical protein
VARNFSAVALPKAADAFAFGVVLEQVALLVRCSSSSGADGFAAAASSASARSWSEARPWVAALLAISRPQHERHVPSACPPPLARLVRQCCVAAPEARPAFGAIRAALRAARAEAEQWPAEGLA